MTILLRTIHGSTLYNLNHATSDQDFYEVYSGKGRARQSIVDGIDTLRISYDSFMWQCQKGVPQALEALYSPVKEVNEIQHIVNSFNPVNTTVYQTYARTIVNFWACSDIKRKRHSIRLCLNLHDILKYGKFNPQLSAHRKDIVIDLGTSSSAECPGFKLIGMDRYTW